MKTLLSFSHCYNRRTNLGALRTITFLVYEVLLIEYEKIKTLLPLSLPHSLSSLQLFSKTPKEDNVGKKTHLKIIIEKTVLPHFKNYSHPKIFNVL